MIDRKQQARYYRELGRREGEIDALYADGVSTAHERAEFVAMKMRIVAYRRYFIAGYVEEAEARALARQAPEGRQDDMRKKHIYSRGKERNVVAYRATCPRCRGFGRTTADRGEACPVCRAYGWAWVSDCGVVLAPYARRGEESTY